MGCEARTARAEKKAADLAPVIAELQVAGVPSLRGIAAALNERNIPTARGQGVWQPCRCRECSGGCRPRLR